MLQPAAGPALAHSLLPLRRDCAQPVSRIARGPSHSASDRGHCGGLLALPPGGATGWAAACELRLWRCGGTWIAFHRTCTEHCGRCDWGGYRSGGHQSRRLSVASASSVATNRSSTTSVRVVISRTSTPSTCHSAACAVPSCSASLSRQLSFFPRSQVRWLQALAPRA